MPLKSHVFDPPSTAANEANLSAFIYPHTPPELPWQVRQFSKKSWCLTKDMCDNQPSFLEPPSYSAFTVTPHLLTLCGNPRLTQPLWQLHTCSAFMAIPPPPPGSHYEPGSLSSI